MSKHKYTMQDANFWKITIGLGLSSFIIFAYLYVFQPLLPFFTNYFSISATQSSFLISFSILGLIAGLFILGFLSDRYGRNSIIYFSLFGSVIPLILIPISDSFYLILFLRFIQGFAIAGLPSTALAYISEEIDYKHAKIAVGFYISSNAVGGMLGRVISGYLTDIYSWQTTFYIIGIIGFIIALIVFIILPKSNFFIPSTTNISNDLTAFKSHLSNPLLFILFGLGIILQLSFTGIWTYLPFHLDQAPYNLSAQAIGYLFFAYIFGVIGPPISSSLANRFGTKKVRNSGMIILTIGLLLTMSTSLIVIIIGLCIICFGFFTAHSLTLILVNVISGSHYGSAFSLYFLAYYTRFAIVSYLLCPFYVNIILIGFVLIVCFLTLIYFIFIKIKANQ